MEEVQPNVPLPPTISAQDPPSGQGCASPGKHSALQVVPCFLSNEAHIPNAQSSRATHGAPIAPGLGLSY
jgi:hypothetical protein